MNVQDITSRALEKLSFEPTGEQLNVLAALSAFASGHGPRDVYILNGYAGTGKTSIVGAVVSAMTDLKMPTVILAPTGRAAKVAGSMANGKASTVHRRIYHPGGPEPGARMQLSPNRDRDTLFIVDEASLLTDRPGESLLENLVRHIYSAPGCAMVLVGDKAQLPPVGQEDSPAMNPDRLRALGLNPIEGSLDMPARQEAGSGILFNADIIRRALFVSSPQKKLADIFSSPLFVNAPKNLPRQIVPEPEPVSIPPLTLSGYDDIRTISSVDLAEELSDSWSRVGPEETLIITRSNKRANNFNMAIRNMVMDAEEPLQRGDRLVISKNDYYWSRINKLKGFVANGDIAIVKWVGRMEKACGRWFCDVELELTADGSTLSGKLMMRSLMSEGPSIPTREMDSFFQHLMAEQEGTDYEKITAASGSPYFNALQAKYAYCVTCHKAQGGEWKHVYIDMGGIAREAMDRNFLRWLYTAMTRATERLYLINPTIEIN